MRSGRRIVDLASRVFGDDVAARVFEPLVADWQCESAAAPTRAGRALSQARGWASLTTASLCVASRLATPRLEDLTTVRRGVALIGAFAALGAAVQLPLFVPHATSAMQFLRHALLLLPALVGFSIPLAWLPLAMRVGTGASRADLCRRRWLVVGATLVCILGLLALNGFISPVANQAWRAAVAGRDLAPGLRELSLPHLVDAASTGVPTAARELRDKLVLTVVWPVALALLGWRLGRHSLNAQLRSLAGWWTATVIPIAVVELFKHGPDYDQAPWAWPTLAAGWFLAAMLLRPKASDSAASSGADCR